MTMPDNRRKRCRSCGRHEDECGPISWRGKCHDCGQILQAAGIVQQANHTGPVFEHWRNRVAASVGATIIGSDT